jgi:hypothetical protein
MFYTKEQSRRFVTFIEDSAGTPLTGIEKTFIVNQTADEDTTNIY